MLRVVVGFLAVLDDVAAYSINVDIVFLRTVAQIKIEHGTTIFHVKFEIISMCATCFFSNGDGLRGADFALRQGLLFVALIGGCACCGEKGGKAKAGEESFVHEFLQLVKGK